jgi:hypothetical protein
MCRPVETLSGVHDTTRRRPTRCGMILMLTTLLVASALPAHAWYGPYGGYWRPPVWIAPRMVVPVVPFWAPAPYVYPPVVVAPPPRVYVAPPPPVYVEPPPSSYWYYCDNPPGYYPHVPQCPGGWRAVVPTSPR